MGQQWQVTNEEEKANFMSFVAQMTPGWVFEWRKVGQRRSNSANNLFHKWCDVAATFFKIQPGHGLEPKEKMKLVFKEMFLGREDLVISDKKTIEAQLRQTSKLDKSEMCHFMSQIDAWCASKGCALPHPEDNEYMQWKKDQEV